MTIGVLGPLVVTKGGHAVPVRQAATAVVLSVLAIARRPVTSGRLDDVLALVVGGEAGGRGAVPTTIWRLRRALGPDVVASDGGYALDRTRCTIDVERFEDGLVMADAARLAGDHRHAATCYREALAAWRGPALPLIAADPEGAASARRLDDLRRAAIDAQNACQHLIREGI